MQMPTHRSGTVVAKESEIATIRYLP